MSPGTYNYTFQCSLPRGLPSSVEHKVGQITYGVCVALDIPMWLNTKFNDHFTVIKSINLNADPSFRVIFVFENICIQRCGLKNIFRLNSDFSNRPERQSFLSFGLFLLLSVRPVNGRGLNSSSRLHTKSND